MTRASDTARLLGAGGSILGSLDVGGGQIGGRRNIVINGAMNVAQRSASVTGIGAADGYFTLDRWEIDIASASAGRLTMTQTADGPNGVSANCLKLDCTTADTSIAAGEYLRLLQKFEGQDLQAIGKGVSGAKDITVSFYVKANAAFTFGLELFDNDNTRQMTKLFATTTDWVRHELTFPADEDDGSSPFADDNALSLQLAFFLHAGSTYTSGTLETAFANRTNANRAAGIDSFYSSTDNNFFITGVQMEVGSVATPFEHRSYGEELALCQRYFHSNTFATGKTVSAGGSVNSTTIAVNAGMPHPVIMRASPTGSVSDGTHFAVRHRSVATVCTAVSLGADPRSTYFQGNVSSGLTLGDGCFCRSADDACTLSFDAEL